MLVIDTSILLGGKALQKFFSVCGSLRFSYLCISEHTILILENEEYVYFATEACW
jgi:hypothetical protein